MKERTLYRIAVLTLATAVGGCGPPTGPEECDDLAVCVPSESGGVEATIHRGSGTIPFAAPDTATDQDWLQNEYVAIREGGAYLVTAQFVPERADQILEVHGISLVIPEAGVPGTLDATASGDDFGPGVATVYYMSFIGGIESRTDEATGSVTVEEASATRIRGTFSITGQLEDGTPLVLSEGRFDCLVTESGVEPG